MDTQLAAEKIFNFCKEKYPDLDWNSDFTNDYKIIQCLTFYGFNIDFCTGLDGRLKCVQWQDNTIGRFKIWINPPTGFWSDQYEDIIVFENLAYYRHELWSAEDWKLVSQYRKIMLDIFTFILDKVKNI